MKENFIAAEESERQGVNDKGFMTGTLSQVYIHTQLQVPVDHRCRNEVFWYEAAFFSSDLLFSLKDQEQE